MLVPPAYSALCSSRVPRRNADGGSPRPGISTYPSTVTAGSPGGATVTKAPPPIETTPGSVTQVTSMAARAASTALPPSAPTLAPACAARRLGAATTTRASRAASVADDCTGLILAGNRGPPRRAGAAGGGSAALALVPAVHRLLDGLAGVGVLHCEPSSVRTCWAVRTCAPGRSAPRDGCSRGGDAKREN